MKDITLAVVTWLKADPAVSAIVGTRIYRKGSVPVSPTAPYIVVSKVDGNRPKTTHNRTGTGKTRVQTSTFAATDPVADNLSECIADSLNMVTDTYMPPGVFVISISDQGAVPDDDPTVPLYMYHRDFMIKHNV
jgi:hypothetical protein